MMLRKFSGLCATVVWLVAVRGQTLLSTVPGGPTVIVSQSVDPAGVPIPVAVGTVVDPLATQTSIPVPGASTAAPTVPATTPTVTSSTPRVVGQPGPTNADPGPTMYTYTTMDANGQKTVIVDTYTPSFGVTTIMTTAPAGTVIPYDQYTSMYGGGGGSDGGSIGNSASRQYAGIGMGATVVMCIIGGATLLL